MRGRSKAGGALVVIVVALLAYVLLLRATRKQLEEAKAQLRPPHTAALYEALAPTSAGGFAPNAAADPIPEDELAAAKANIEAWDALRAKPELNLSDLSSIVDEIDSDKGATADTWTRLRAFLDTHAETLTQLRETAARGGPLSALRFTKGYQTHWSLAFAWNVLLDADAALALREGDTARAEADLLAVLQVGELLYEEPLIAANWSARDAYRRVYRRLCANPPRSLSAEAEQALLRQWVHGTDRTAFAESFLGEAVAAANTFEDAHGSVQLDAYRNGSFRSYLEGGGQYIYTGVLKPWFDRDVAYYLGALRAVSGAVSLPYPEARIRIGAIALEAEQLPWTYRISRQSPEAWIGLLDDRAEHEALFGLAQLGLTIERHAHEMGSVPASLDEIAARLPAGPPTDPFTEQPYIYRTSDDGFILYSVGSNGIDNGGQHSHEDGDIVWRGRNDDVRQTPVTVVNSDGEEVGPFESDE